MLAEVYRSEELSDCDLVLLPEDQAIPKTQKCPAGSRKEPAHLLVLAETSERFKTEVRTDVGSGRRASRGTKRLLLQVTHRDSTLHTYVFLNSHELCVTLMFQL
jgi:hypothetical protein